MKTKHCLFSVDVVAVVEGEWAWFIIHLVKSQMLQTIQHSQRRRVKKKKRSQWKMRGKKKSERSRRPTVQIPLDLFCVHNCLSFILYPSLLPLPLFHSSAACTSDTHALANAPRRQTNAQIWLDRPKIIVPHLEQKRYPPPHVSQLIIPFGETGGELGAP